MTTDELLELMDNTIEDYGVPLPADYVPKAKSRPPEEKPEKTPSERWLGATRLK